MPDRDELKRTLAGVDEPLRRRLQFVALLSAAFAAHKWLPPVVVGGHAVEFYSAGGYTTADIDLASPSEPLDLVLSEWGFRRVGRHWLDDELALVVEAPASQLGPGQRERATRVRVGEGEVLMLSVEDLIVDRLNACVHWRSEEDCEWAAVLIQTQGSRLDWAYLRGRANQEQVSQRLETLLAERAVEDSEPEQLGS
jgi:hypothetical protein